MTEERIPLGITRQEREAMLEQRPALKELDKTGRASIEETARSLGVTSLEAINMISREVQEQTGRGLQVDPAAYTRRRLTSPY